jgi:catechol 2,3-dioxygenase-like lactoylglutathione lyase family enzyme
MGIKGLSHVGIFVRDLETMTRFYEDVLGLEESHRNEGRAVFLSGDTEREDHEIVLFTGREGDGRSIQQISFRVDDVEDVLRYYRSFKNAGVSIDRTVSHGRGVSCYFLDPEGNRLEVFADIEVEGGRGYAGPLDLEKSAEELTEQIRSTPTVAAP